MDSQIKEGFYCDKKCYSQENKTNADHPPKACSHTYKHITQQVTNLNDSTQQETIHTMEENSSSFTTDVNNNYQYNITQTEVQTDNTHSLKKSIPHMKHKHKYHNTFSEANINYHNFDNYDALTHKDKYTTLLEQELQNPYWCLHDPIMTNISNIRRNGNRNNATCSILPWQSG